MSVTVTTQEDLDKALKSKAASAVTIYIESPRGVWIEVAATGEKDVVVRGSASVSAYDSASVRASGSASVSAYGSASVSAYGSASVSAYGSASVRAGNYVAVHLHSAKVKLDGGVLIDMTKVDRSTVDGWIDYHSIEVIDGAAILYKAVDDKLRSGYMFEYPIGARVEAPDWKPNGYCGNGLHFCPSPAQALDYHPSATRFLKVSVPLGEISVINGNDPYETPKVKAKGATVLCEVDVHGREVTS